MKYDVSKIRNSEIRDIMQDYMSDIEMRVYGVSTEAELIAAVADTSKTVIHLLNDITLTATLVIARTVEINGHGHSLTDASLDASRYIAVQLTGEYVTIDNVAFNISGNSDGNALYSIDVGAAGSRIENCTFTMANAGSTGAVSVYYEGYANQALNYNTLSNGVAITGSAIMVDMRSNSFAATKGIGLGVCTVGGYAYTEASPTTVAAIKAYLKAQGNTTTGEATGLVVEGYLE